MIEEEGRTNGNRSPDHQETRRQAARWTLEILSDAQVKLTEHKSPSRETVRRRLEENDLKPWCKVKVIDRRTAAHFAARMRDLTDIHFPEAEKIRSRAG